MVLSVRPRCSTHGAASSNSRTPWWSPPTAGRCSASADGVEPRRAPAPRLSFGRIGNNAVTSGAPAVLFCIQCVLFSVFPLSHGIWQIDMIPSSSQWRARISSPDVELEATSGSPEDYDDRSGYLPDFLGDSGGLVVPLPLLRDKSDLLQVERAPTERPFELRYQNFSVIMSRSRRFCCITGVNIDGSAPFFRFKRPGWKTDPRIPKAAQIDGAEFTSPPFSIVAIWSADSIRYGARKALFVGQRGHPPLHQFLSSGAFVQ